MALAKGFRLGPYAIQAAIGAGGMGEVYRALDTRLDRFVAVKILPVALAMDPQFRERFDREARAISQLTHPHICTLHDVGRQDGVDFLVMEYLEGETLAARLERGPLALDEALRVAMQIAGALSTAHAAGFVHRDLKPGNVFLTKSGAKLLDFGLAKTRAAAIEDLTALPTAPGNLTTPGAILGTFQYMAPEQLEAQEADARTDIFAFGCVLYEMITGRKAFEGKSQASVMAAILEREPPALSSIQRVASPHLEHIVARCLVKNPDARWQTARDLEEELRWVIGRGDVGADVANRRRPAVLVERVAWALLVAVAGAGAWTIRGGGDMRVSVSEPRLMRFDIATPPTSDPLSFALSPDGRQLAFVASADGVSRLWVRPLDQISAEPLANTAGALFPFWSPDSRSIGFFADGKLKRIEAAGGSPRTLADAVVGRGGTWSRENVILFSPNSAEIFSIPANGGQPVAVTSVERPRQANHRFPCFLPDGRHFIFYAPGDSASRGVYLASLDTPETHRLLDVNEAAVISAGGHILFVRENSLFAQALDPQRAALVGDPVRVAEQVMLNDGLNTAAMSAAPAGTLAYRTGAIGRRLAWFDRAGKEVALVVDTGAASNPELSRDGGRIAIDRVVNGNRDIWLIDARGGTPSRFSFDPALEYDAVWSPDQTRIVFASNRTGVTDIYQKLSSGAGEEELLIRSPQHKRPLDFSPDGQYLLYREFHSETGWDLLAWPLAGDRKPLPVVQSRFDEREGQLSPDGKWVAYQSNDTGSFEIYVQAFPGPGGKWQVSTTGGAQPRWRRDGKELFYVGLDGRLMAVTIQMTMGGQVLQAAAAIALFSPRLAEGPVSASNNKHQYAVAADGQRFLINVVPEGMPAPPISIVLDWDAHLRK